MNRFVASVLLFGCLTAPRATTANPLFPGADPDAAVFGKTYWIYPTRSDRGRSNFKAFSSTDLRTWTTHPSVLDLAGVPWVKEDGRKDVGAWAPSIFENDGKFYFYYSVGPQSAKFPSRIGVAVGDKPQGPFKDSGKPLVTGGNGFEAIDPMVYKDPKSGVIYLYAGGSAGAKLRVWELQPDCVSLKREVDVKTPKEFTEGAFMHDRDGVYYLSYSHGTWSDSSYSVHYSTAPSPVGPWTYRGAILTSDDKHKGPGHHSFVKNPTTGQWLIVYHRYESTEPHGPYRGGRRVAVETMTYDKDGLIEPIKMTDGPPKAMPIN